MGRPTGDFVDAVEYLGFCEWILVNMLICSKQDLKDLERLYLCF